MNINERKPEFLVGSSVHNSVDDAHKFLEKYEEQARKGNRGNPINFKESFLRKKAKYKN